MINVFKFICKSVYDRVFMCQHITTDIILGLQISFTADKEYHIVEISNFDRRISFNIKFSANPVDDIPSLIDEIYFYYCKNFLTYDDVLGKTLFEKEIFIQSLKDKIEELEGNNDRED